MNADRYAHAAAMLEARPWKLFETEDQSLLPDGAVRRYVAFQDKTEADAVVALLRDFTDAVNYVAAPGVRQCWVDGLAISGIKDLEGKYRGGPVAIMRADGQRGVMSGGGGDWWVVQTLYKGFLTALSGTEARLIQGRSNTGDAGTNAGAEYLTLEWVGVNPDNVKPLADGKLSTDTLAGLTYREVQDDADVIALGAGWHVLSSNWELAQDGSGTVRLGVAKPEYTLAGFSNWLGSRQGGLTQYFDVPEALAQGILTAAQARGADARATGYNREQGLVNITVTNLDLTGVSLTDIALGEDCDFVTTGSFTWGTSDNTVLPIPVKVAGVTYRRNVEERGDGSFSVSLIKRTRQYRDLAVYDSEHRADRDATRKEWKGVTTQNLGTALDEQAGKIVQVDKSFNDDCSEDIRLDVITPESQTTTHASESRADQTASRTVESNAAAKADATPVAGKVVRANSKENEFGRFDNTVETITPVDQSTTSGEDRADQSSTVTEHTQAAAAVTAPPTSAAGTIERVQNRETEFGKFATREETLTAKAQTTTHASEARADQTASRTVESNAAAKADATPVAGKVVRANSKENEFGRFDNTVETITPVDQTATDAELRADRTSTTTKHTQADAEADEARDIGGSEDNAIIRVSNVETEFGKHRTSREVIQPVDQSTTSGEDRADQSSTVTEHTQAAAAVTAPPTSTAGTIERVQNRETEFGKFATREETLTAKAQTTTHASEARADQTASRTVESNAAAKADATPVAGKVVRSNSKENEFGRFDNSVETITPVDQSTTSGEDRADQSSTVTEHTQADAAVTAPPTSAAGTIERVQNRETEFGKFATREETLTAKNQTWTEGQTRSDQTSIKTVNTQAAAAASAARGLGEDNNIIRVNNRETEFGKFANEREVITAVDQTHVRKMDSAGATMEEEEHTHAAAALAAPSASTGQRKEHFSIETPFGTFRTTARTSTGVEIDTGWQTYAHPDGNISVRSVSNGSDATLTAIKATLTTQSSAGDLTSLVPRKNDLGLWEISAWYRPRTSEYRISTGNWNSLSTRVLNFEARTLPNDLVRPQIAVKIGYHSTETNAWAEYGTAITTESPAMTTTLVIEGFGKWSAGVEYLGQNKWRSIRIEEKLT